MNFPIGAYGTFNGSTYAAGESKTFFAPREDGQKIILPAAEKEKEQERRELMGLEDPAERSGAIGEEPDEKETSAGKKALLGGKNSTGRKNPGEECETCKKRKYQDGSDEMVSFKSAAHISPESAAARVRAHEQEHVSNAYKKAAEKSGKVISASVSIQTAICPECGRTYVSGGTTHTQIKYYNEENPYQKGLKTADQAKYSGMNMDYAV